MHQLHTFDELLSFLDREHARFEPGRDPFTVRIQGDDDAFQLIIRWSPGSPLAQFTIPLEPVPEVHRVEVALACTRINSGLPLPGFTLRLDTGRLSYRVALPVGGGVLWVDVLRDVVTTCFSTCARHYPALRMIQAVPVGHDPADPAPWWAEEFAVATRAPT